MYGLSIPDKRKSTEVRVYEAGGFLERERFYTL